MRTYNIGMMCPNPKDATSFYRAWGPFNALRKEAEQNRRASLNLIQFSEGEWPKIDNLDIAFLQRPFQENHVDAARVIKDHKIPLWVDFDDDLLNVPEDNPSYGIYKDKKNNILACCEYADIVTASMPSIISNLNVEYKGRVIENGVPESHGEPDLSWKDREKVCLWRGSASHQGDLLEHKDEILSVYEKMSKDGWKFVFMGWRPWFITKYMDKRNCIVEPFFEIYTFAKMMKEHRPRIVWFPLIENEFNKSKSLNAWEDATHCGALMVCPKWYQEEKNTFENFEDCLKLSDAEAEDRVREAHKNVLYLKHVNYERMNIIEHLGGLKK